MREKHGKGRFTKKQKGNQTLTNDLVAMRDILWRAVNIIWFEYPAGYRLLYFRWPKKYQIEARDGVPVYFWEEGPKSMRTQTPIGLEETIVLRDKILKVIKKRYLLFLRTESDR